MLIAIIFGLTAFIIGVKKLYTNSWGDPIEGFFPRLAGIVVHLFITVMLSMVGCLVAVCIGLFMPKHWEEAKINLVSLKDANGLHGNSVLGIGSIGTEQYYMWYENTGHGYRPGKVKVDENILINEDSTQHTTGTLVVSTRKMNNAFLADWIVYDVSTWSNQYLFTIPVGTIKKDFKL